MNKPMIVLDTNILLVSISSRSLYHWIFKKLINGEFDLLMLRTQLLVMKNTFANLAFFWLNRSISQKTSRFLC
jgi:hypothetical protein